MRADGSACNCWEAVFGDSTLGREKQLANGAVVPLAPMLAIGRAAAVLAEVALLRVLTNAFATTVFAPVLLATVRTPLAIWGVEQKSEG